MLSYDADLVRRPRPLGAVIAVLVLSQVAVIGLLRDDPSAGRPRQAGPAHVHDGDLPVHVRDVDVATLETPPHPLVGAHYHVWYPSNFDQGFLREKLVPPQEPSLGRYDSGDPSVAEAQIEAASASGVDFFTIDWWPSRTEQNVNALSGFLEADNIADIDFALFYEVWDLGFDAGSESTPMVPETIQRFVADMDLLADTFFDHPSYLEVDGRPVVILYLSRTMTGDVAGAVAAARARMQERGIDVILIGDEVFWRPLNPERMQLFDAITAYNLYDSDMPQHAGYASETAMFADQLALYRQHGEAAGRPIVPVVFPGYNDRGVRPAADHYAVPRRWAPGQPEGTLLREMIDRVARPLLDPRLPMLFVTSWNEWNEDTAIEPLRDATETAADSSASGGAFTQGYAYGGGDIQVRALRDEIVSVAGRVLDRHEPVAGRRVEARDRDGVLLAADVTDSDGRFTLSRWLIPPGEVTVSAGGARATVTVDPERTTDVRLRLGTGAS